MTALYNIFIATNHTYKSNSRSNNWIKRNGKIKNVIFFDTPFINKTVDINDIIHMNFHTVEPMNMTKLINKFSYKSIIYFIFKFLKLSQRTVFGYMIFNWIQGYIWSTVNWNCFTIAFSEVECWNVQYETE